MSDSQNAISRAMKPMPKRDEAEERASKLRHEAWKIEEEDRKTKALTKLPLLPEGWEEKLSAAVIEAVRQGERGGSCELTGFSHSSGVWATIGFSVSVYAIDHSKDRED